ncbi:MAG: radical SAM family heme chaperone HemW [Nitrospinota bacterium]|nr:radical SAM family heme chaperone HemW [Nitrospinota bacterium]
MIKRIVLYTKEQGSFLFLRYLNRLNHFNITMNPLGIYIHIPYCLHKCGYCDFNSHRTDSKEMAPYVDALLSEMSHYAERLKSDHTIQTLFLGGGTPTTLPPHYLKKILHQCRALFDCRPDMEISLEANPATIEPETLPTLHEAGYNRISIGVQSFHEPELKLLDRIHSVEEIHSTVALAREARFDNLSVDLMFALPRQTKTLWGASLRQALEKNPEHLSTYNLTIEPGTAFEKLSANGKLVMPEEDLQLALYRQSIETLKAAGYRHYEISNFAKPGKECRHNITYWQNGETLGLGAGASSYLGGERFKNFNLPSRYIREINHGETAKEFSESLEPERAMGETLMLGMRLLDGLSIPQFESRFDTSFQSVYGETVDSLIEQNLITLQKDWLSLSEKGLFLADSVILEFIPGEKTV